MRNLLLALTFALACSPAFASNYQDIWYDPNQPGMGVLITQQGNFIWFTWFTYDANGNATWYLFSSTLAADPNTQYPTGSGNIALYNGTPPTQYNPAGVSSRVVGSGSVSFQTNVVGTFNWNLSGRTGTMNLVRYNISPVRPDGNYLGGAISTNTGCTFSQNNGKIASTGTFSITSAVASNGIVNKITAQSVIGSQICNYSTAANQLGNKLYSYYPFGTYSCNNGISGTFNIIESTVTDTMIQIIYQAKATSGESCFVNGNFLGVPQ